MGLGSNNCSNRDNAQNSGNDNITVLPNNSIAIKRILPLFGLHYLLPKGPIRILEKQSQNVSSDTVSSFASKTISTSYVL